jgi:hypothetical protein
MSLMPVDGLGQERTWLILQRDLSVWLRQIQQLTFATVVMDLTDEGTRAVGPGSTSADSLVEALSSAAREPMKAMEPAVPDRIQAPTELADALRSVLGRLVREAGFHPDTIVEEVTPEEGAEWVFDDLIAQMAGRTPAEERLQPEDAAFLYEQARSFMQAAPWTRWTSEAAFLLELKIGSQRMEGILTVLGHEVSQPGLMLMPGRERAGALMASSRSMPIGTLVTQLEGTEGHPDLFLRARRYGWPVEATVTPSFISVRSGGFQEIDRRESWPMALAMAAVVAHAQRGESSGTWGTVNLPSGRRGRYHIVEAPADSASDTRRGGEYHGIKLSADLIPNDSEIQIGVVSPRLLAEFRRSADVAVPCANAFPDAAKRIPMIALTPSNRAFTKVVDRLQRARPIGATVIETESGPLVTVIGERAGFVIASGRPMAKVWKRNIQESDGAHVLIVTDGVVNHEEPDPDNPGGGEMGHIYGLFECLLRGGSSRAIEH